MEVRIDGTNCLFRTQQFGGALAPIDALKLDKKGVEKEHPDLKGKKEWREEAIKRFKKKLKSYRTEKQRMDYIKDDLQKFGYIPIAEQRSGFRPRKLR